MDLRIKFGAIAVLKELHLRNIMGCNLYYLREACGHGHLDVVMWLLQQGLEKLQANYLIILHRKDNLQF